MELERAAGALVGLAVGDALGAGYELTTPDPTAPIEMRGGGLGPWAPGEWTDDTQQAICLAQVTATGRVDPDRIGHRLLDWHARGPKDVGTSTRAVLEAASRTGDRAGVAERLLGAAFEYFGTHPTGAAGNGSLMRTAPVALAHLRNDAAIAASAREVSRLTHGDPLAAEACVLWCIAIDRAVRHGRLDGVWDGLALLAPDRAAFWRARLAEAQDPDRDLAAFADNGFVVTALQAAHAAISRTPVPDDHPCHHLQHALEAAVRIGHDTDTVAAIAGQVAGARWGASAVPWRWRQRLHGWPSYRYADLVRLAVLTANRGLATDGGWPRSLSMPPWARRQEPTPVCVPSPDDGLLLGNLPGLEVALAEGVDAVVSLSRVGTRDVPDEVTHVPVWLVDRTAPANPNLGFVVDDTVDAVRTLRAEGRRVYLHCVGGRSRTPLVAAAYLAEVEGMPGRAALDAVAGVLPEVRPNPTFLTHLEGIAGAG
jgi:ADP-ribosylglycohydrolase